MTRRVDKDAVVWGYRLFLDREPENHFVVEDKVRRFKTITELRKEFMGGDEFQGSTAQKHVPSLNGEEPPMQIEEIHSEKDRERLFRHIQETWQHLGKTKPFWSVLSADAFEQANINRNKEIFYESGRANVDYLLGSLRRIGVDDSKFKTCLEYGCGLGRITRWLAERYEKVYGYDISQPHLQSADAYLKSKNIRNVELIHVKSAKDTRNFPKVDLVYSILVLQHNPPPMMKLIIEDFMGALNPGGVAFFQLPTFRQGYCFILEDYLRREERKKEIEMHVLPQKIIFDVVYQNGGSVLEVIDDNLTGGRYKEVSNTFVVQKR